MTSQSGHVLARRYHMKGRLPVAFQCDKDFPPSCIVTDYKVTQLVDNSLRRVWAEVELANGGDVYLWQAGEMSYEDIRREKVDVIVSSGSQMLGIVRRIKINLGLPVVETQNVRWACQEEERLEIVGPVQVTYQGRSVMTRACVLPPYEDMLLGMEPMAHMGLVLDMGFSKLLAAIKL